MAEKALRLEAGVGEMWVIDGDLGMRTPEKMKIFEKAPGICTLLREREIEIESGSGEEDGKRQIAPTLRSVGAGEIESRSEEEGRGVERYLHIIQATRNRDRERVWGGRR
jgi:hypothetical protein